MNPLMRWSVTLCSTRCAPKRTNAAWYRKLYSNMEEFADELRREGFQEVHYIPFIERERWIPKYVQAPWMLYGVGLIYGKK